jgi:hypothetical protein
MCYWFPRAQQRLTLLTYESGPEIAGYSFLLLLLLLLIKTMTLSGILYTVFFSINIRILWERIRLGSPSILYWNVLLISQGTTDCTLYLAHLLYPFHILLFWVSGLLLDNSANEIAGWVLKPKCVVIPVRIQSGDIHAIKRTYLTHTRN